MNFLTTGIGVFILIHLVPSMPVLREAIVSRVGANPYKGLFSLLSLAGLILIVVGLRRSEFVPLYDPPVWGRTVTFILVFVAIYLFLSSQSGRVPSSARYWTAHPLSWGVVFWSAGHLLSNGDNAHVVLFGAFLLFGLIGIYSGNRRGQKPAADTRPAMVVEIVFIAVVAAVYVGLIWAHRFFTGMPLL